MGYNARVETFRDAEYPMLDGSVYLDHAGTTLYPKSLVDRFARDMTGNLFGNPHSHSASASSQSSTARIEDIRLRALRFFNADPAEFDLVFVPNATAGIKLVADALRAALDGFDYAHHQASHTSLVGVREEARNSLCLDDRQVEDWLAGSCPFADDDSNRPVLFAYPAQSNMDGRRYPLDWAARLRSAGGGARKNTYTLLDAAALVCSAPLDLGNADAAPDFTVLSFYKIFGFPDLGALIVRREAEAAFSSRRYFGGGTVDMVVCLREQWHAPKTGFLHERLEDGTLPIHSIVALDAALDVHKQLYGSIQDVAAHTAFLSKRLYSGLEALRHANGELVCVMYSPDPASVDESLGSGPVVAFNIRNSVGAWVSLTEVDKLATLKHFHLRTGGVCNPGGIASALGLEPWEMRQNFSSGFRCGTENDILAGKPTGVVRASLGAMSSIADVDSFVGFVSEFYRDPLPPPSVTKQISKHHNPARLHVHSIHVYPIKSCAGFQVPPGVDWEVKPEGLTWDREWCLVHQGTGQALSQKRYPKMALLQPSLDFSRGELRVSYTGQLPAHIPREISIPLSKNPTLFNTASSTPTRPSRVCGDEIQTQTYASPTITTFFSTALGVPCLLARFPPGGHGPSLRHAKAHLQKHQLSANNNPPPPRPTPRLMPGSFPGPPSPPDSDSDGDPRPVGPAKRRILLANESPILAITLPSLAALNKEIQRSRPGAREISPAVFRANIVIGPPYVEDEWAGIKIGSTAAEGHGFEMLGACRRCHMVCVDQETGEKGEEPFVSLSRTRRFGGMVFFGVHMGWDGGGGMRGKMATVRVGDGIVPEWRG
ncbi:pyridoxal phosphate-dependent transferase [Staphylotrichum tortipilum]|uniref:Molybdenum cofactor sulfurase n=1 Tax=Staphylotrichum tortipilum TaxID=2831512 RepID=A0AAN6RXT3_9PEZI|nr:pyridoxal phosphate-dependent transferase [Staphylotrichum longicolle]